MARKRHLDKAPIREAVIDLQVSPPVSLEAVDSISSRLRDQSFTSTGIWQASVGVRFAPEGESTASTAKSRLGVRFDFKGIPRVLQCRVNGFTFSRLPQYDTWEEMSDLARECWQEYVTVTKPELVTRIQVRYINALTLPVPIADFRQYLLAAPEVPATLPQTV